MMRIVIIGNSGGGKSVLARRLAHALQLPCIEIDSILWLPGWQLAPATAYNHEHDRLVAQDRWVIEGLGTRGSVPQRLERATHIAEVDRDWMPEIRLLVDDEERRGKQVFRLASFEELNSFVLPDRGGE